MDHEKILALKHASERLKTQAYAGTMAGDTARDLDMIALIDGVPELVKEIKRLRGAPDVAPMAPSPCAHTRTHDRADTDGGRCVMGYTIFCVDCGKEMGHR